MKQSNMYKRIIIAAALLTITGVLFLTENSGFPLLGQKTNGEAATIAPPPLTETLQRASPESTVGIPVRLEIPEIKVDANIQFVGQNDKNEMDTPSNGTDVAWYKFGPRPGEPGNAVIAGHLDTFTSRFGVFMNLEKLAIGSDIYVKDDAGKTYHFKVTKKESYGYRDAPVKEIFGESDTAKLNLITCGGVWDRKAQSYTERLVIYTELVSNENESENQSRSLEESSQAGISVSL